MVYEWKGRKFSVDPNTVGREVEKIEKAKGEVTARDLVEAARAEDSVLHRLFEWDDAKAADGYRLHQANKILCALSITMEGTQEPTVIRAWMNIADEVDNPTRRTGTFVNTQDAFRDPQKRDIVLRYAIRELREIQRKYAKLTELAEVFEAIEKL